MRSQLNMKHYLFSKKRKYNKKKPLEFLILKIKKASKLLRILAFFMEYYIISKYNRELQP